MIKAEENNKMAKITKATVKSFIKKNIDDMYINVRSSFDGMTDGLESNKLAGFHGLARG